MHFQSNKWSVKNLGISNFSSWNEDGVNYELFVNQELQYLQVGGPSIPWRLVALPPSGQLMCLIRPNNGPTKIVHPFEVTITSQSWEAETILTLMRQNAADKAEEIFENSHLKDASAESLLRNKMSDPTSAAIAGYYLLKYQKFDRLHDWARNLANWIDWMPDGSIIWAWQLIKQGRIFGEINITEVRLRLLEATKRGMPIYTEGLKLLWEGLKMLNYGDNQDEEVKTALNIVGEYVEAADWNSTVTTFNGKHPARPSKKSRKGTPKDKSHLAYIYDVPGKAIMQVGTITENDTIELVIDDTKPTLFKISKSGMIQSDDGKKYKSIFDIAKQSRIKKEDMGRIIFKTSKLNMDDEIRKFRTGGKEFNL